VTVILLLLITPFLLASSGLSITVATSKKSYLPGENIKVFGNLTWDDSPVDGLVALQAEDPSNETIVLRTLQTGSAFETGPIEIVELWTSDLYGTPKAIFDPGTSMYFNLYANNTGTEKERVLLTVNVYDTSNFTLGLSGSAYIAIYPGESGGARLELEIPTWASAGNATGYAVALTNKPKYGGVAYCPEKPVAFEITGGAEGSATTSPKSQSNTGNYNLTFKLSAQEPQGTYMVYASSSYQEQQVMDSTTFTLGAVHDIAITSVTPSSTWVYQGNTIDIYVEVKNKGDFSETFNVTAYYDGNVIETRTDITLEAGSSTTLTFAWDTTGVTIGDYTIKGEASEVPGETDTTDNTLIDDTVQIRIPGDINGDGDVDSDDFYIFAGAYGSSVGDPAYNPNADIDGDGYVDSDDFYIFAGNYGKSL